VSCLPSSWTAWTVCCGARRLLACNSCQSRPGTVHLTFVFVLVPLPSRRQALQYAQLHNAYMEQLAGQAALLAAWQAVLLVAFTRRCASASALELFTLYLVSCSRSSLLFRCRCSCLGACRLEANCRTHHSPGHPHTARLPHLKHPPRPPPR
jgi:hypothetical protein